MISMSECAQSTFNCADCVHRLEIHCLCAVEAWHIEVKRVRCAADQISGCQRVTINKTICGDRRSCAIKDHDRWLGENQKSRVERITIASFVLFLRSPVGRSWFARGRP